MGVWRVQILSLLSMAAKISVLGPIRSYSHYLSSAQGWFPLSLSTLTNPVIQTLQMQMQIFKDLQKYLYFFVRMKQANN